MLTTSVRGRGGGGGGRGTFQVGDARLRRTAWGSVSSGHVGREEERDQGGLGGGRVGGMLTEGLEILG